MFFCLHFKSRLVYMKSENPLKHIYILMLSPHNYPQHPCSQVFILCCPSSEETSQLGIKQCLEPISRGRKFPVLLLHSFSFVVPNVYAELQQAKAVGEHLDATMRAEEETFCLLPGPPSYMKSSES